MSNIMNRTAKILIANCLFVFVTAAFSHCVGKGDAPQKPVYASDAQVIYNGSIYYNEAGCASCHGSSFKGDGPDKGARSVPDLTAAIDARKTPLDYFKTITAGKDHPSYQGYTDRGRWAMAHFLYSLSSGIKPSKKSGDASRVRREALAQARLETERAYAKSRRWFLGMKPPQERIQKDDESLALDKLIGDQKLATEPSLSPVSEKERTAAFDARHERGAALYRNNCASCHGKYGEGSANRYKLGLTKYCKERGRNCAAYLPTANIQNAILGSIHAKADTGLHIPGFDSFSDEDWAQLSAFLRGLEN